MSLILESSDHCDETKARTSQFSYYIISAHNKDYVKYINIIIIFM